MLCDSQESNNWPAKVLSYIGEPKYPLAIFNNRLLSDLGAWLNLSNTLFNLCALNYQVRVTFYWKDEVAGWLLAISY